MAVARPPPSRGRMCRRRRCGAHRQTRRAARRRPPCATPGSAVDASRRTAPRFTSTAPVADRVSCGVLRLPSAATLDHPPCPPPTPAPTPPHAAAPLGPARGGDLCAGPCSPAPILLGRRRRRAAARGARAARRRPGRGVGARTGGGAGELTGWGKGAARHAHGPMETPLLPPPTHTSTCSAPLSDDPPPSTPGRSCTPMTTAWRPRSRQPPPRRTTC